MHIHTSKELREKLKIKKRALLPRKGDRVKILRGSHKGKEGKVARVNYVKCRVYVEGIVTRTARGREALIALQPSNLIMLERATEKEKPKEEKK